MHAFRAFSIQVFSIQALAPSRLIAALLLTAALFGAPSSAAAQGMPSPFVQEVLVKSILVTLSDAVAADNFTVLHAKISKPFREQFPPENLRAVFKDLIDKRAVFDNPRHDYPKRIVYELSAEGGLSATIGFLKGGTPRRFEFQREDG